MKGAPRAESELEQDVLGKMLDQYAPPAPCKRGDIVEGVIVCAEAKSILVDIGCKSDAIVLPNEVDQMTSEEFHALQPGQTIYVYIVDNSEKDNVILVSIAKAAQKGDWNHAHQLMEDNEATSLEVIDFNKGGVIVNLGQLRGFVPSSQLSPTWHSMQNTKMPDRRWEALLGKTLKLKVIEVTPNRNRLILSERSANPEPQDKQAILERLEVGTIEKGIVSNVVDFGAFVNVKGMDGLLHISELSWQRVKHPSEIVKPGQKLEVYILDIDLRRERLSLSLKRLKPDPWKDFAGSYQEGQEIEVKIVNLTSFGAFACPVELPQIEGLIHISELCEKPILRPDEVVQIGMHKTARIISLRPNDRRIAFSLKQVCDEMASMNPKSQEQTPEAVQDSRKTA